MDSLSFCVDKSGNMQELEKKKECREQEAVPKKRLYKDKLGYITESKSFYK